MRELTSEQDFADMMAEEQAPLFVLVGWSEYATSGKETFQKVEATYAARPLGKSPSWWIVDITDAYSPTNRSVHRWLSAQQQKGRVRLFPNVAMGGGAVLWMKRGEVVDFEPNAKCLGLDALVRRTQKFVA